MQKVAHYRRVIWLSKTPKDLKNLLDQVLSKLPDVKSTKFAYRSDIDVQISYRDVGATSTGIYVTLFKEGRPAATVENGGQKVSKRKAPRGEEFLRTGIMIIVTGNHLAFLADGHTNDGQITAIFHRLFKEKGMRDDTTQFQLQPKANKKLLSRLLKQGVRSIDLDVTSFSATVDELNKTGRNAGWLKPLTVLGKQFHNAFSKDRSPAEAEAASEIEVSIHLGYDGRGVSGVVPKLLGDLAIGVEQNASEFKIVTKDNAVITHDKLIIKMDVEVVGDDVASDPASAFGQLKRALIAWKKAGVLDE